MTTKQNPGRREQTALESDFNIFNELLNMRTWQRIIRSKILGKND